jgi:hypothetical protein
LERENLERDLCFSASEIPLDHDSEFEKGLSSVVRRMYGPIKKITCVMLEMVLAIENSRNPSIRDNPACGIPSQYLLRDEALAIKNFIRFYDQNPFKDEKIDSHISRAEALRYFKVNIPLSLTKTR